jgi:hypothetical protein
MKRAAWKALVISTTLAAAGCGGQDTNAPKAPSAADGGVKGEETEAPVKRVPKEGPSHEH